MSAIKRDSRLVAAGLLLAGLVCSDIPATAQESGEVFSLQRAIQVALTNSHDINAAEEGLRFANQQVREAWSNVHQPRR
jgi:hypothetical protein